MTVQQPTAKSLTLDLLSSLRGDSMPISALVAAAALFGVPGGSLRVAVTRLLAQGQLERAGRGRYRLGPNALAVDRHAQGWRSRENRLRRWGGRWIAVHGAGSVPDPASERALAWLGFEAFRPGLHLRPDNWKGGVDAIRTELHELGLALAAPVFRLDQLSDAEAAEAGGLWDLQALVEGYRFARSELARSARNLARASEADAMVESFLLGGEVIRQLARDPLLPDALVASEERRAVVDEMRLYDRAGRRAWASFMARHGAPHIQSPSHGVSEAAPTSLFV
jgi:phenylacetic acid degradation operon negative regulatory protein